MRQPTAPLRRGATTIGLVLIMGTAVFGCGSAKREKPSPTNGPMTPGGIEASANPGSTDTTLELEFRSSGESADVLVLDDAGPIPSLLTRTGERVKAYYRIHPDGSYQAMDLQGEGHSSWLRWQDLAIRQAKPVDILEHDLEPLKDFKTVVVHAAGDSSNKHAQTVLETLLHYNPRLTAVFAEDLQAIPTERYCQIARDPDEATAHFERLFEQLSRLIETHGVRAVSRSMQRRSKHLAQTLLRACDDVEFSHVNGIIVAEQRLMERVVAETGVAWINAAHNDPEDRQFFLNGMNRVNPLYQAIPKDVIFVGYTNRPQVDFFPDGVTARENFVDSNQWSRDHIQTIFIDGNIHHDRLLQAKRKIDDAEDAGRDVDAKFIKSLPAWSSAKSFQYVYGLSVASPYYGTPYNLVTSGFATSWATPLATGMILDFLEKHAIDFRAEDERRRFISHIKGKIYDPIVNDQFSR